MAKVKIISNPYQSEIVYQIFDEVTGGYKPIADCNPDSRLREDESRNHFLPFKIKEIVDEIIHDYWCGGEKVEIIFEGTNEEYREVEKVCATKGISDKISLRRTPRVLENARSILQDTKEIFRTVEPIIKQTICSDELVMEDLQKVSDALDDIIPICVFGNYSAGKSTFINALIGHEVLPSGGDPVTAKVYEIRRSEHQDVAKISFSYRQEDGQSWDNIRLLFDDSGCRIASGDKSCDILTDLCLIFQNYTGQNLIAEVNKVLEFINGYEKKDKEVLNIGAVITVEIPFSHYGILGQSQNRFVIFDTPGSNSASNADHSKVLENALKDFSNGIPVWVSQFETMDSEDNAALCDRILSIKALDSRFTMIVLNKADNAELPEGGFSQRQIQDILDYRSVRKMNACGIFFVSSIMGLGAKKQGNLSDKHYRKIYRQQDVYSDPEDVDYTTLYRFNIMPQQIKDEVCRLSAEHSDLIYANSGLFCIEKEMEDFASKYSAYNKCRMVFVFLNDVIAATNDRIQSKIKRNTKKRDEYKKKLNIQKQELLNSIQKYSFDQNREFSNASVVYIKGFTGTELDYSYDVAELDQLDAQLEQQHQTEANFSAEELKVEQAKSSRKDHLKANLQKAFSWDIKKTFSSIAAMTDEFVKDSASLHASRESKATAKREIDIQTSDVTIQMVNDTYKSSIMEAKERLCVAVKTHWIGNAQKFKELLIGMVTETDALSDSHRTQLSEIIMEYQSPEFDDAADNVFIKAKFLRGNFFGLLFGDSERLNIKRLAKKYNERIAKDILEMALYLNESYHKNYLVWQSNLIALIERNIVEFNPQLREIAEDIRDEEERIAMLQCDLETISTSLDAIKELMDWKDIDSEEMLYGY